MAVMPEIVFSAEDLGPPHRKFWIWHDPPRDRLWQGANDIRGWGFAVDEYDANGRVRPFIDTWEMTFEEIVRYPELYGPKGMVWRSEATGEVVDIYASLFP